MTVPSTVCNFVMSVWAKRSECSAQTPEVSCPNTRSTKPEADLVLFALRYVSFRNAITPSRPWGDA